MLQSATVLVFLSWRITWNCKLNIFFILRAFFLGGGIRAFVTGTEMRLRQGLIWIFSGNKLNAQFKLMNPFLLPHALSLLILNRVLLLSHFLTYILSPGLGRIQIVWKQWSHLLTQSRDVNIVPNAHRIKVGRVLLVDWIPLCWFYGVVLLKEARL